MIAAFSAETSDATMSKAKSSEVPAPRPVSNRPSVTVRWSDRIAGNSAATEK